MMHVMCSKVISDATRDQKTHCGADTLKHHGTHEDQEG